MQVRISKYPGQNTECHIYVLLLSGASKAAKERPTLEHRLSNFIHKNNHIRNITWAVLYKQAGHSSC